MTGWLAEGVGHKPGWMPAGLDEATPMLLGREDCDPVDDWEFKILGEPKKRAEAVPLW